MASVLMQMIGNRTQSLSEGILRLALALLAILIAAETVRGQVPRALDARLNLSPEVREKLIQQRNEAAKPAPAELDAFRQRMDLQLRAWLAWTETKVTLTADQRSQVIARIQQMVQDDSAAYANTVRQYRLPLFREDFPYLFQVTGSPPAPRPALHVAMLQSRLGEGILTNEQLDQLAIMGQEHLQFRRQAFRDLLVSRMDRSVGLSDSQLEIVRSQLQLMESNLDVPFFTVEGSATFPTRPISVQLTLEARVCLTPGQLILLGLQRSAEIKPSFTIPLNPDVRAQGLETAVIEMRGAILGYYLSQIERQERVRDVSEEAATRIRAVAKGASVKIVEARIASAEKQLEEQVVLLRDRLRILDIDLSGFSLEPPTIQSLESDPMWVEGMRTFLNSTARRNLPLDREALAHTARAGAVLAMLDQELWLTGPQRERLLPIIIRVLDQHQPQSPDDENLSLLGDLALPLHRISPTDREAILSSTQQEVWNVLAASFEFQAGQSTVLANSRGPTEILEWKWRVVAEDQ